MEKVKLFLKKKISAGATQMLIAEETGISQGAINKILRTDVKVSMDTLEKIATAYNVPLTYFINTESGPSNTIISEIEELMYSMKPEDQQHILTYIKTYVRMKQEAKHNR